MCTNGEFSLRTKDMWHVQWTRLSRTQVICAEEDSRMQGLRSHGLVWFIWPRGLSYVSHTAFIVVVVVVIVNRPLPPKQNVHVQSTLDVLLWSNTHVELKYRMVFMSESFLTGVKKFSMFHALLSRAKGVCCFATSHLDTEVLLMVKHVFRWEILCLKRQQITIKCKCCQWGHCTEHSHCLRKGAVVCFRCLKQIGGPRIADWWSHWGLWVICFGCWRFKQIWECGLAYIYIYIYGCTWKVCRMDLKRWCRGQSISFHDISQTKSAPSRNACVISSIVNRRDLSTEWEVSICHSKQPGWVLLGCNWNQFCVFLDATTTQIGFIFLPLFVQTVSSQICFSNPFLPSCAIQDENWETRNPFHCLPDKDKWKERNLKFQWRQTTSLRPKPCFCVVPFWCGSFVFVSLKVGQVGFFPLFVVTNVFAKTQLGGIQFAGKLSSFCVIAVVCLIRTQTTSHSGKKATAKETKSI